MARVRSSSDRVGNSWDNIGYIDEISHDVLRFAESLVHCAAWAPVSPSVLIRSRSSTEIFRVNEREIRRGVSIEFRIPKDKLERVLCGAIATQVRGGVSQREEDLPQGRISPNVDLVFLLSRNALDRER